MIKMILEHVNNPNDSKGLPTFAGAPPVDLSLWCGLHSASAAIAPHLREISQVRLPYWKNLRSYHMSEALAPLSSCSRDWPRTMPRVWGKRLRWWQNGHVQPREEEPRGESGNQTRWKRNNNMWQTQDKSKTHPTPHEASHYMRSWKENIRR